MNIDYDADRKDAALRVEQMGMKSNDFEILLKGIYGVDAVIEIKYLITGIRRAYAAGGGETAKNWIGYFLGDLKDNAFTDGQRSGEQYANMQVELLRLQHDTAMQKWKNDNERLLKKWQDRRDIKIKKYWTLVDGWKAYAASYLKLISILNGGAIVTILTFAHNILLKPKCHEIADMLAGSSWFIYGLLATLLATAIGYWSNVYYTYGKRTLTKFWWITGDIAGVAAFGFFFWGTQVALKTVPALTNCL